MAAFGGGNRCIFCHGTLPANEAVEHFPLGSCIAFDPCRARLWAVCPSCHRWNLAPFEERWEALEELEKAQRDTGRVLASTPNISLIQAPGIELVRVGEAPLGEEAWWRYGSHLVRRRTRARVLRWTEQAVAVGASVATGGMFWLFMGGDGLNHLMRWRRFGSTAWRGESRCIRCDSPLTGLSFKRARRLHLARGSEGDLALHLQCTRCRLRRAGGGFQIEGPAAGHILRRVVTYSHYRGASEKRVRSATEYIERRGAPEAVTRELMGTGLRIGAPRSAAPHPSGRARDLAERGGRASTPAVGGPGAGGALARGGGDRRHRRRRTHGDPRTQRAASAPALGASMIPPFPSSRSTAVA